MHSHLGNLRAVALCHLTIARAGHLAGESAVAWTEVAECIRQLHGAGAITDLAPAFEMAAVITLPAGGVAARAVTLAGVAEALRNAVRSGGGRRVFWLAFDPAAARAEIGEKAYEGLRAGMAGGWRCRPTRRWSTLSRGTCQRRPDRHHRSTVLATRAVNTTCSRGGRLAQLIPGALPL